LIDGGCEGPYWVGRLILDAMGIETTVDLPEIGSLAAHRDFKAGSDQVWSLLIRPTSAATALQPIILDPRPGGRVIWRPAWHPHEEMEGTVRSSRRRHDYGFLSAVT